MSEITPRLVLCTLQQLAETGSRGFEIGEGDWPLKGFLVQLDDGQVRAWVNSCPHAGHALDLLPHRFLSGDRAFIRCSSHGALFERDTGRCVAGPCTGKKLRPIEVSLQADAVLLASEPTEADNARPLPDRSP